MLEFLSQEKIDLLLSERKFLPRNWRTLLRPRPKANLAHRERDYSFVGERGSKFTIWIRESRTDPEDYTVGVRWIDGNGEIRRLRRYNGPGHRHVNHYEKRRGLPNAQFNNRHHIHFATERYQLESELALDGYAEVTDSFSSLKTAVKKLLADNGFVIPSRYKFDPRQREFGLND